MQPRGSGLIRDGVDPSIHREVDCWPREENRCAHAVQALKGAIVDSKGFLYLLSCPHGLRTQSP